MSVQLPPCSKPFSPSVEERTDKIHNSIGHTQGAGSLDTAAHVFDLSADVVATVGARQLAGITLTKTSAAAVTSFIPTLVATFGFSKVQSLLMVAPPYVFAAIVAMAVSITSDKLSERYVHLVVPLVFGMVGYIIAATTMGLAPRYFSLFLMLGGVYGSFNVALAWVSSTVSTADPIPHMHPFP